MEVAPRVSAPRTPRRPETDLIGARPSQNDHANASPTADLIAGPHGPPAWFIAMERGQTWAYE